MITQGVTLVKPKSQVEPPRVAKRSSGARKTTEEDWKTTFKQVVPGSSPVRLIIYSIKSSQQTLQGLGSPVVCDLALALFPR